MARVSNDLDVREAMGLKAEAQQAIEGAKWVVLDSAPDFAYKKSTDSDGNEVSEKTDTQNGTTVLLGGPRKGDKLVRNKEMKVKLDDVWTEEECRLVNEEAPELRVKITRAVIWGSTKKDSTFVSLNLSLHAELIDENGEVFDPRNLGDKN